MAGNVTDLPSPLADAVRRARSLRTTENTLAMPRRVLEPRLAQWAQDVLDSGELDRAIAKVAARDPELA